MTSPNFIDYVSIYCKAGKGGSGSRNMRREKFVAKGGPDGGDGGRGGHIFVRGNKQKWTLLHLRYCRHLNASNGESGGKQRATGAQGKDVIIEVPLGTIVRDAESKEKILEILDDKQLELLKKGGDGGKGNWHFKTSTRQTPRYAQPGKEGEEGKCIFELKVLADVGLVGFPNAGKSTLLSVVSSAKPKIDIYPFTTLTPNLGIVQYLYNESFVMADIPGIIKGASQGKGLGIRFLRHIERNSILLFLIPADSKDPNREYQILLKELYDYNPSLLDKEHIVVISKSDLIPQSRRIKIESKWTNSKELLWVSSFTKEGLDNLKKILWELLNEN